MIINADSAQMYRDIPVLSAAPSAEDRQRAEHRLYGERDGSEPCSAAEWARLAQSEIADVHSSELLPILVGGTGLYIRTLLDGIAAVPPVDPAVRQQVRSTAVEENRTRLEELDPEAVARLEAADSSRIARALEVVLSTGRPLAEWQQRREGGIAEKVGLRPLILLPPRPWLYERCNDRFEAMVENGAIEEVQALLARGLDPSLPVMRAIGVGEIAAFLEGETNHEQMVERGQQATRNYAKRQYTWFAHQTPGDWPRFTDRMHERAAEEALALLGATA